MKVTKRKLKQIIMEELGFSSDQTLFEADERRIHPEYPDWSSIRSPGGSVRFEHDSGNWVVYLDRSGRRPEFFLYKLTNGESRFWDKYPAFKFAVETAARLSEATLRLHPRRDTMSEGLRYHMSKGVGIERNIYRPGSNAFFTLFREVRELWQQGLYEANDNEHDLLETDLGEFAIYRGKRVPLDWPMLYSEAVDDDSHEIDEAKYQGREVELGKPKRGSGGKAYVYVRNKKGNVIKVNFGSSMPDAMGDSEAARKRRKSFGDRHNCADKKDRTKAGYWSCRATKFFGRNIPGWW